MHQDIRNSWDRFVNGDTEAFGDVYQAYLPMLTLYCLGVLHDRQTAEHCATESLIKTMNHRNPETIQDPEKWLFIVAKNQCISELRKAKRLSFMEPNENQRALHPQNSLRKEEIDSIIESTLSSSEQDIWHLHSEGYTNDELAAKLGSTPKTMANKKSEIRLKLKAAFAPYLNLGKKNT